MQQSQKTLLFILQKKKKSAQHALNIFGPKNKTSKFVKFC